MAPAIQMHPSTVHQAPYLSFLYTRARFPARAFLCLRTLRAPALSRASLQRTLLDPCCTRFPYRAVHPPALIEVLLACSRGPTAASTTQLTVLASSNNPRFWDQKICSEQWFDTNGKAFSIIFLVPELKDVRTVKAQFELCTLDDLYPSEAVICSKKAANTLMYLVSKCEKNRGADNRKVIQFLCSAGASVADPLHFVVHSDHLFPQVGEVSQDVVPEFSLEDFENVLKELFSAKKGSGHAAASSNDQEVREWRMKDMLSPQGHLQMVMDLYNVDNVPIVVPNVRDAAGGLIHPSEYSKKFRQGSVVAMEVVMCFKRLVGSRIYQTCLKSLHLLLLTDASVPKAISHRADNKGKHKADGPAGQASPVKKGTAQERHHQE
ncbi:hypothetical protein EV424DRAFT_1355954 [Suillus variegatus]|nr:hypothetical protein EV424DRAFT_1355954 [Suillus variegatus]